VLGNNDGRARAGRPARGRRGVARESRREAASAQHLRAERGRSRSRWWSCVRPLRIQRRVCSSRWSTSTSPPGSSRPSGLLPSALKSDAIRPRVRAAVLPIRLRRWTRDVTAIRTSGTVCLGGPPVRIERRTGCRSQRQCAPDYLCKPRYFGVAGFGAGAGSRDDERRDRADRRRGHQDEWRPSPWTVW
jgi:hypothetical protein